MLNILLYLGTILIWGSTWLAIQFQVADVNPVWSVAYRFGLASLILFLCCLIKKIPLRFTKEQHAFIFLQSIFMFSLTYIFYYLGSAHLKSGYVAILGATVTVMNIVNARLFLAMPIQSKTLIGSLSGVLGLVIVFWQEFSSLKMGDISAHTLMLAILSCLIASYTGSLGNVLSKRNQNQRIPILSSNAWGMLYGTLFTVLIAGIIHAPLSFRFTPSYISALLYLSIFGSVIAFGFYLKLIGSLGPDKAAYIFVLTPIVALILSSFFEAFHWQLSTLIGIILILVGNSIVMPLSWKKRNL